MVRHRPRPPRPELRFPPSIHQTRTQLTHRHARAHAHSPQHIQVSMLLLLNKYPHQRLWRHSAPAPIWGISVRMFISPPTLAPLSWTSGRAHTTRTSLAPCSGPCLGKGTSPCPAGRRSLPAHLDRPLLDHLYSAPGKWSAPCHGCGTIHLGKT